jgi:hypothetical protein
MNNKVIEIKDYQGDIEILKLQKTVFLCSRKVPASIVLKCYDWAIEQREAGNCIISGFHSQLERDVFHYLSKGTQPIIVAMARGLTGKPPEMLWKPIDQGRILLISPFKKEIIKVTFETAAIRNRFMIYLAENITIGYASETGQLNKILKEVNKPVTFLYQR